LHDFYKTLLFLQTHHPALHSNSKIYRIHGSGDEKVLAFLRKSGDKEVLVLLNFSSAPIHHELYDVRAHGLFKNVFTNELKILEQNRSFDLTAWGYLVYVKEL
jgi:glycosidase